MQTELRTGPVDQPDVTELGRVAVDGRDPEGGRVEVIGARRTDGTVDLYVPAKSHTVRLTAGAVSTLAGLLAPDGPASITVLIESQTGEFTIVPARVEHGRLPPERTIRLVARAMAEAMVRVKQFGFVPPARRARKTA